MVCDIFAAVPSQPSIASDRSFMSFGDAFMIAKNPDMAFLPTRASAADAASESVSLLNAARVSLKISPKLRMLPSVFVVAILTSPRCLPVSSMSPCKLVMIVRRDVPAWLLLMPAFAISPIASAVSSAEYPRAPAIGAQYLKVSPIMLTLVLALELAAARISAKCPESFALILNAVRASVTMSDVVARSSPDAAARSIMPPMPSSMSPVFQPAIAI